MLSGYGTDVECALFGKDTDLLHLQPQRAYLCALVTQIVLLCLYVNGFVDMMSHPLGGSPAWKFTKSNAHERKRDVSEFTFKKSRQKYSDVSRKTPACLPKNLTFALTHHRSEKTRIHTTHQTNGSPMEVLKATLVPGITLVSILCPCHTWSNTEHPPFCLHVTPANTQAAR
jgi:hypothetical protein